MKGYQMGIYKIRVKLWDEKGQKLVGFKSAYAWISDHQQSWGYEDGPWKGPGPPLLVAADFKIFFNLCFIGPVVFDEHWTD